MEPQEGLAGLQGNVAKSAKADQTPATHATQATVNRSDPEKHHLGLGRHARHALLRQAFRTLNVIDKSNRESLGIEIDAHLHAEVVIHNMEQLCEICGLPQTIRLNSSPELRSAT